MAKKRRSKPHREKKASRGKQAKKPLQKSLNRSIWSRLRSGYKGIVAISVLVSLIGFVFLVYPRLTITPGITVVKLNPFYTPFVLSNDGYLPIKEIEFTCGLGGVTLRNNKQPTFSNFGVQIANTGISSLSASESTSIEFNRIFNQEMPIASADIEVLVSYKPFLVPFRLSKSQRFKTMLNYNGELVWTPAAGSSMK